MDTREEGAGKREQGTGSREQGTGNREQCGACTDEGQGEQCRVRRNFGAHSTLRTSHSALHFAPHSLRSALFAPHFYCFISKTDAIAATPSSLPANPILSVVVALMEISRVVIPTMLAMASCMAAT